jgi:hypothetical protein
VLEPFMVKLTPFLRGVLPTSIFEWAGKLFGVSTSMMHWRGHNADAPAPQKGGAAAAASSSLAN